MLKAHRCSEKKFDRGGPRVFDRLDERDVFLFVSLVRFDCS